MKKPTQPASGRSAASKIHLRRTGAALAIAPVLAFAACSSEVPLTANQTHVGQTTAAGAPTTAPPSDPPTSTTPSATPSPQPTRRTINVTIKDPTIGHQIQAIQVVRNLPWPKGHPIASQTLEIVGVRLTVTAGDRYSASFLTNQLSLRFGTTVVPPTPEFGDTFGTLLTTVNRGQHQTGWVIFKVDQNVHPIVLQYDRPAYKVSTTGTSIPAQTFSAQLTN